MLSDINFLISYFLHGDIDVLGDIVNIAIIASPFFQSSFSPSNGKVGNANLSKSDSNSRSWQLVGISDILNFDPVLHSRRYALSAP
jgi:hypothetical protein